jgi:hypothetical protein
MPFTPAALRFFKDLKRHNNKLWLEAKKQEYPTEVVSEDTFPWSLARREPSPPRALRPAAGRPPSPV